MKRSVLIAGPQERYGNYVRAVLRAGGQPRFPGEAEEADALLLPGGGDMEPWRYGQENTACRNLDPARDQADLDLLDRFVSRGKPVLGICRGMQTINVFFGGTLFQDIPGHGQRDGQDSAHAVRTASGSFAAVFDGAAIVNSAHHQAADRLGAGLRAEQWAADGVVEALRHTRLPVWGVQWHPERLPGAAGPRLLRAFLAL